MVDEVTSVSVLEGHELASDHHFECLCLPNQTGQASGPTGTCENTKVDFRKSDLAGVLSCDSDVSRHCDFESATNCVAVDCADNEFGSLLQSRKSFVCVKAEVVLEARSHAVEHLNRSTCGEEGRTVSSEHNAGHIVIETSLDNCCINVAHHSVGVGVWGAVVCAFDWSTC